MSARARAKNGTHVDALHPVRAVGRHARYGPRVARYEVATAGSQTTTHHLVRVENGDPTRTNITGS